MKSIMHPSIKKAIQHSGLSDIELGLKLNVSRSTIFKWRTIENYKIRSSNIIALAKLLDKEVVFDKGYVSFENKNLDIDQNSNEDDSMKFTTDELISDLRRDKKLLYKSLDQKDKELQKLKTELAVVNKKLDKLTKKEQCNMPQIDHAEYQIITKVDDQTYHSVSSAYARLLGYSPIVMLSKEFKWDNVIHPDDHFKCDIISALHKGSGEVASTQSAKKDNYPFNVWKLRRLDGSSVYVSSYSVSIGDRYSFVQMEKTTKEKYQEEIENYYNKQNNS